MSERTFNNDEVAALLERAAELQSQTAAQRRQQHGLTLDELADIAAESGLDPELLRQAAAEMESPDRTLFRSSEGTTKTHVIVERWIPGELSEAVVEEIVMELRSRFDSDLGASLGMAYYGRGTVDQIGRSVEWKHMAASGVETRVLMRPRGEGFHMRLSQRVGMGSTKSESIGYSVILALLASPIAFAIWKSGPVAVLTFLATLAIFVPLIAHWDTTWRRKKHQVLQELGDDLSSLAVRTQEGASTAPVERVHLVSEEKKPLIALDGIESGAGSENDPAPAFRRERS